MTNPEVAFLVSRMGDPKPIREIRQRIMRLAQGTVLEIGAGTGANFVHYDPTRVTSRSRGRIVCGVQRSRNRLRPDEAEPPKWY